MKYFEVGQIVSLIEYTIKLRKSEVSLYEG
jgi:hypothetical protein